MPRAKVNPLNRRRVAQACTPCKKRKEKCDGVAPCGNCKSRRNEDECSFSTSLAGSRSTTKAVPLLRESPGSFGRGDTEAEIDMLLDHPIEDYARPDPERRSGTTTPTSAPVPKFSRMMRDGKGRFSMPPVTKFPLLTSLAIAEKS